MTQNIKDNHFAIQTIDISRKFRNTIAVDGVDLSAKEGELFSLLGLLGLNDTVKTTIIKMLCCLLSPSAGTATIKGYDIQKNPIEVKQLIDFSK